ncbi:1,4-alpha-glucan branching protein domain-containing protein [Poriferisphaera sp. WC338]|uniref:1,4-alpha-glucan branching protein domain-containing protein n=1 Tax=Poriferisphaera sp. WC338 TaxID=3425129 RepID=UPI003D819071
MSETLGSFCLVLHGHLPYVLRHGTWPHGEDWLYEAAAETYLPILAMLDECVYFKAVPKITMGLTPVLLEQLNHEVFKTGFIHYLEDRIERARKDQVEFKEVDNGHMKYLAERWEAFYKKLLEQFESYDRDIPAAFAERAKKGYCEILTSNATHAYMPLLYEDASIRAQIRAGVASSERILGFKPTGMWLPECAYRPSGDWNPPIGWGRKQGRIGVEHLVADEGVDHFFVESHLIEGSRSEQVYNDGKWWKVDWDEARKYPNRGWRSVNEPHGVNSDGTGLAAAAAFARDQAVCEQVWSGAIGYPADGVYLEFHKAWSPKRGLRYWKITGNKVDLGDKHLYVPDDVPGKMHEHVSHFVNTIKDRLRKYRDEVGRPGVVVTSFDAELFGHWWFEGPQFLRDVMLSLNSDPEVTVCTTREYLDTHMVDKVVALPEGSWGEEGDHRVWTNDQVNWMWDIEYRCESTFGKLTGELDWRKNEQVKELLEKAGRELLLLQASDWPFVIRRGQAVDYGIKRFMQHVSRFEVLTALAEKVAENSEYLGQLNEVERFEVQDADIHDVIFPEIDLNWWNM